MLSWHWKHIILGVIVLRQNNPNKKGTKIILANWLILDQSKILQWKQEDLMIHNTSFYWTVTYMFWFEYTLLLSNYPMLLLANFD